MEKALTSRPKARIFMISNYLGTKFEVQQSEKLRRYAQISVEYVRQKGHGVELLEDILKFQPKNLVGVNILFRFLRALPSAAISTSVPLELTDTVI